MNVSGTVINKLLRDQMRYDREYSYSCLFGLYNEIMNQDRFCTYNVKSFKTFRNNLNEWAAADSWLVKVGEGKQARFSKREPSVNCPFLNLVEWVRSWKR